MQSTKNNSVNEIDGVQTESSLSSWVGPDSLTSPMCVMPPRGQDDQTPFDDFAWTSRLQNLTQVAGLSPWLAGPASAQYGYINILNWLKSWNAWSQVKPYFYGFNYSSINCRVTISNPKGMAGAMIFGWFPYVDYYDEGVVGTIDVWMASDFNTATLINSSDSQLVLFGNDQDISFSIPWTFKYPLLPNTWIAEMDEAGSQNGRPPYGSPVFYWKILDSAFVNTVTSPAQVEVYVEYKDMHFYGPGYYSELTEAQSGVEGVMAGALVGAAADMATSFIHENVVNPVYDEIMNMGSDPQPGNYDNPQAVQMSYFGDTTSVSYPQTRPIFKDGIPRPTNEDIPKIHDYLMRPQYIGKFGNGDGEVDFLACPGMFTNDYQTSRANYFRYFAMISRYWRGTMNFHFIIAGHQFVETRFNATVMYEGTAIVMPANITFQNFATHRSISSGGKHIIVPVPYLSNMDYTPIFDGDGAPPAWSYHAWVRASIEVINTMLDVVPVITCHVFVSAGPDFRFYQPYPCGLYNTAELVPPSVSNKKKDKIVKRNRKEITSLQVGLPFLDEIELAQTRAVTTPDPGTMVTIESVVDMMKIWSRAIPFYDYNPLNEEPIPDPKVGLTSPCWFPPVDRARNEGADNSWFITNDYVAYFSILFLYWRGTIGAKVGIASNRGVADNYVYVAMTGNEDSLTRKRAHCPFTYSDQNLPPNCNFGTGAVATPATMQPIIEVSIPYRGVNTWSYTILNAYGRGVIRNDDRASASVTTNIILQVPDGDLADAMFRKVDSDFALCVESTLPPYAFWSTRGVSQ